MARTAVKEMEEEMKLVDLVAEKLVWEANTLAHSFGKKEHFQHHPEVHHQKRQMLEESR